MHRLQGKTAIITGAARGMGAATAELFVAEGARVILADLLTAEGEALAQRLGASARFVHHDVTDEASWQRVLSVNLTGSFLGVKHVGAHMLERGRGSIVNISLVEGMKTANGLGAYCSSKWGIRGLTKVAAMEYGHKGVRVSSVHPGGVDTAMGDPYAEDKAAVNQRYQMVPMQRVGEPNVGEPNEVAHPSLFLASDESSYLCGAEITVDGGMTTGFYYVGFPGAPGVE